MNDKIDFSNPIQIHFIGIGGISMSGLAEILLQAGFVVTGSDAKESELTRRLSKLGAKVYYGHQKSNISDQTKAVVFTAAVKPDNEEYQEALRRNLPIIPRAQLLGQLMSNYRLSIGVSGTHGKTTTTSMLSEILLDANTDPTISVGGMFNRIQGNIHVGDYLYFITEACEYTNSFLYLYPNIGIILNICADHLDFFKDLADVRHSFREYAKQIKKDGLLIMNYHIPDRSYITDGLTCRTITFGLSEDADYYAANIQYDTLARGSFDLYQHKQFVCHISLGTVGEHNILNALSAIAAAMELHIDSAIIQKALLSYVGTDRRFQVKGTFQGCTIIDDYAHHPDEIQATLTAAKHYPHNNLWCVFQPHTYSRTQKLLPEFAKALSLSDFVVLADIYAAREKNTSGISSMDLVNEIKKYKKDVYFFSTFDEIQKFLSKNCVNGDLLITMGAGDIVNVGEALLKQ